ncbi:MAG: hypothetical protein AAF614_15760 [Chloroflexota bacterium]
MEKQQQGLWPRRTPTPRLPVRTDVQAGKGLGDVVADFTHNTGLDALANKYGETTGKDCGCDARQETLNQIDVPFL